MRELSARGLSWEQICDTRDKLVKEGITSRETLTRIPLTHFTPERLCKLGITVACVRQIVLEMRLQATWLGARLTAMGVSSTGLSTAEAVLINCATESSFAQVVPEILSDANLRANGVHSSFVCQCLRAVHRQVRAENAPTLAVELRDEPSGTVGQDRKVSRERIAPHSPLTGGCLTASLQSQERGEECGQSRHFGDSVEKPQSDTVDVQSVESGSEENWERL